MSTEKEVPTDGSNAFYRGFDLEDNPFNKWDGDFEEWDEEFLEAAKNYKQEGRFRDGSFKG